MSYTSRPFWFRLQQLKEGLSNGAPIFVGYLEVWAIGYQFYDGTFRSVDIENVHFYHGNDIEGTDVRAWIKEMQVEKWDELIAGAETAFKNMLTNVANAESTANCEVD